MRRVSIGSPPFGGSQRDPAIQWLIDAVNELANASFADTREDIETGAGAAYQPLDGDLTSWAAVTRASGFDTFVATPSSANLAALLTDESGSDKALFGTAWIASTPTLVGFGTPGSLVYFSKRIGDTLYIRCKFASGTSTGTEARVPLLLNGVSLTSDATKVPSITLAGNAIKDNTSTNQYFAMIESAKTYMTISAATAGANPFTKLNGDQVVSAGQSLAFNAEVPINGW